MACIQIARANGSDRSHAFLISTHTRCAHMLDLSTAQHSHGCSRNRQTQANMVAVCEAHMCVCVSAWHSP